MLTGKTPPAATLVLNKKAALEPELEVKNVSSRTVDAILKAMAPLMDDRPQRVEGFLSMLAGKSVEPEDKTEDETEPKHAPKPTPKPSTAPDPAPTPPGRKPKTWLWALLGGLAALAVVLALVFGGKDWIQGTGDDSGADTLAVAPPETFSEPSVAPSVNDSVPEAPGSIKITSEPAGAAIWLDGKNTGKKTPEILENVASGKHTVQLVLDGYTVYKGNVTVPSGGHTDVARTLTVKEKPYPKKGEATGSTRGTINGHEWVDLGLSVKWATCNVGASTPEAYGSYFAWGETSPKSEYTWENYKFHMSGDLLENITFGKYNTRSERGSVDNKTRLDLSDDAARVNWGGNWRMPTYYEWLDLYTECTWTWTSLGGKNGYEVVSKKNGNSIFLPAAGYQDDDNLANVGTNGFYWSSSLFTDNPNNAWNIYVNSRTVNSYRYNRYYGFSVRPVSK